MNADKAPFRTVFRGGALFVSAKMSAGRSGCTEPVFVYRICRRGFFSTKQSIYRMICISDRTMHWMICIFTGESAEAVRSVWTDLSGMRDTSPPEAYAKTLQNRQFRIHPRLNTARCEIQSPHRTSCTVVCRMRRMYQVCIVPLNAPVRFFSTKLRIYRMNCISDRTTHWIFRIITG